MIATAHRPIAAAGAALIGAGFIAATPVVAPTMPAIPHLDASQIALQASVLDIFTFPILRQIATNQVEVLAIEAQGLADAGQGAVQSVVTLPPALITATRQVLTGNALDALTTLEDWTINSAEATFVPVISARIAVGQIDLAIQSALLPAWPLALVSLASGLFDGADTIARGVITAGQDLVAAVLSFNLGDIVAAVVGGIRGIAASVAAGAQSAVDGVVGAQTLIADALAARPAPIAPPVAAAAIAAPAAALPTASRSVTAERTASKPAAAVAADTEPDAVPAVAAPAPRTAMTRAAREATPRRVAATAESVAENPAAQADPKGAEKTAKRSTGRQGARGN